MNHPKEFASSGSAIIKHAAIYVRVSTEDQGKGFSIPTQIKACQKAAEHEGYTVPESHVLIDEGISGTTMERPELRRLRALVTTKAIAAVIVYDPDRLSRNLGHQLLLAEECERAGVKLLIVSHPMEQGPEGWLFFQMRGALAEYERAKIVERTRRGSLGRAQAGNPWGGAVPLGYRAVREPHKARWEIDEAEAALVRRIFAMGMSGLSTYTIAFQLSQERQPTRGNGCRRLPPVIWQESTVHKILTNEAYAGRTYWNKYARTSKTTRRQRPREEWVAIPVPAIIDEATFQAIQRQLARNRELSLRNTKREYLLRGGHLRCHCGRVMTGSTRKAGRGYYRCHSQFNLKAAELRCRGSLRADAIEAQVWAAVVRILEEPALIAAEVARQETEAEAQRAKIGQQMALIHAALAKCDREAQRWADAYAAEVINLGELKGYRAEIETKRQGLLTEHGALQAQFDAIGLAVQQVDALTEYCARVCERLQTFNHAEKRFALEALNIRVKWTPGQPLAIEGSIPLGEIVPMPPRCRLSRSHSAVSSA
jgi:site-specific DNA recombinase